MTKHKAQLDEDLDYGTLIDYYKSYCELFKITCARFEYTVLGQRQRESYNPRQGHPYAISRLVKEIHSLDVFHQDLRPEDILWNAELGRTD